MTTKQLTSGRHSCRHIQKRPPRGFWRAEEVQDDEPNRNAKFRLEWASRASKEVEMKCSHKNSFQRVDEKQGDCWPLGRLVVELGGWKHPDAINGAMNVANFCTRLGGDWLHVHPQSSLAEFFTCTSNITRSSARLCVISPPSPRALLCGDVLRNSPFANKASYQVLRRLSTSHLALKI